jgi:hypothetical protein
MKSFCKNCESLQPSSFRLEHDAETRKPYEDLCCNTCHFVVATVQGREALAQPAQDGKCKCVCHDGCAACRQMAQPAQESNFCSRCGKRTNDIHTCTPPQEGT